MWAEPGRAALDVAHEPRVEELARRRLRVVVQARVRETELLGAFGEERRQPFEGRAPLLDEHRAEARDALGPRLERAAVGQRELHATQRGVPLRQCGVVVLRRGRAGREQPAEYPVEVRAA